jgi:hypothetical protein
MEEESEAQCKNQRYEIFGCRTLNRTLKTNVSSVNRQNVDAECKFAQCHQLLFDGIVNTTSSIRFKVGKKSISQYGAQCMNPFSMRCCRTC